MFYIRLTRGFCRSIAKTSTTIENMGFRIQFLITDKKKMFNHVFSVKRSNNPLDNAITSVGFRESLGVPITVLSV